MGLLSVLSVLVGGGDACCWEVAVSARANPARMGMLAILNTLAVLVCTMSVVAAQGCLTSNAFDAAEGQQIGSCDSYIAQGIISCEQDAFHGGQYEGM